MCILRRVQSDELSQSSLGSALPAVIGLSSGPRQLVADGASHAGLGTLHHGYMCAARVL